MIEPVAADSQVAKLIKEAQSAGMKKQGMTLGFVGIYKSMVRIYSA